MRDGAGRTLILGHRGAPFQAPENTLRSFDVAMESGADGVELDLQLTGDGVLVVHHDAVVRRPSTPGDRGGEHEIAELSLAEFRRLAPGWPTFPETLEWFKRWPRAHLNVELKKAGTDVDRRESALVRDLGAWSGHVKSRTWVSSFDPDALARLAELQIPVPLALLAATEEQLGALRGLPVAAVHPKHTLVHRQRVDAWRERGLAIHAWTVNDTAEARRLLELGIDGLIGDDPATLRALRDEMASSGPRGRGP